MRTAMTILVAWVFTLGLLLEASDARVTSSEINDLGIPFEEHKPVSHDEPFRYKREFRRVHPIMGNTTYTYDAMLKQHVVLITPEKGIVALECTKTSLNLFITSTVDVDQFKVGAVLVGGPEYQCTDEDGALTAAYHEVLQVVGVFNSSNYMRSSVVVQLITKEVTLMDLFHYAHVHVHHIPHHQKPSPALMDPNSNESLSRDERFKFSAGLAFRIGNQKDAPYILESDDFRLSCDLCYFQFHVEFEFVLDFSYWWVFPTGVDRFKVYFGGGALLNMDVTASLLVKAELVDRSLPLLSKDLAAITFSIGPVPVVIVPELGLSLAFALNAEASVALTVGFDFGVEVGLGVVYTPATGFDTIRKFELPANLHKPKVVYGGKVYARLYLVPEIVAKIYGVFPITISVQPFVELIFEKTSDEDRYCGPLVTEFRIDTGLQLVAQAKPFDLKLFHVSFGGLLPLTSTFNLVPIVTLFNVCVADPIFPGKQMTLNIPRYYIKADPWGPCSAYCGPGNRTRAVYCYDFNTGAKTNVSHCNGTLPSTTQSCDLRDCRPCGERSCETCTNATGCLWCYDHGGRCEVASEVGFCRYNLTQGDTCPKPLKSVDAIPLITRDVVIVLTGGLSTEPLYPGFSYDGVKWYHGGLFPINPYSAHNQNYQHSNIFDRTVITHRYNGCLPQGNVTIGVFSLITHHTAFITSKIGSPIKGRKCVLYSPYNACSRTCGPATQTRNQTCFRGGVETKCPANIVNNAKFLALYPTTIPCQGNQPCVDKPVYITAPKYISLAVNRQKLFVSWIGGEDYQQVNIAYRYMKNLYNQTWHSWIKFPQSPFPNTGSTNISMATGYPPHTFYQVQVCSTVNESNCDVSGSFSVTKPVKYFIQIIKANTTATASAPTTASPVTTTPPSILPTVSLPIGTVLDAAVKPTAAPVPTPTNFTATVTLRGVALNYSEVSTTVTVLIPVGQSVYAHEFIGYDIGFIYSLHLYLVSSHSTTTPNLIVTAGSATQNVTFGVNVPLSKTKPLVQRYNCGANDQAPCENLASASGCGWCDSTQSCMAGSNTKGFDTQGNVVCSGSQWHPNNHTFYTFSQIMLNQSAPAKQNKRGLVTSLLSSSSSSLLQDALNFTELLDDLLGSQLETDSSGDIIPTQPNDLAVLTTEYESTTESTSDHSTYESTDSNKYSSSENWATSNDDPADSLTTLSTPTDLSTPTATNPLFTEDFTTSSEYSIETYSEETSSSSVSQDPTNPPSQATQAPAA